MACVGNDDDLRAVCRGPDGAFAGMAPGALFVDHTTVSARSRASLHAGRRRASALSMRRCRAGRRGRRTAQLSIMCGGTEATMPAPSR
jgi:3-hydroxyisobutyrate dehydrogenase